MTNAEIPGDSALDLSTLEPHVATLASSGLAGWRLSEADLDVLARAPLVDAEIQRLADDGPATRDVRWDAVERAVEAAIETIGRPFSESARHQFGFTAPSGGAWDLKERQARAADAMSKSWSWYRTTSAKFGGLKPGQYVIRLVSLALLGFRDPVAVQADLQEKGSAPARSLPDGEPETPTSRDPKQPDAPREPGHPPTHESGRSHDVEPIVVRPWQLALGLVIVGAVAAFVWYSNSTARENLSIAEARAECSKEQRRRSGDGSPAVAFGQFISGDAAFGAVVARGKAADPVTARSGETVRVRIRLSNAGPRAIPSSCVAAAVPESASINPAVTFYVLSPEADPQELRDDVSVVVPGGGPVCLEFVRGSGRVMNARLATIDQSASKASPIVPDTGTVDVGTEHTRSVGFDFKVVSEDLGAGCG